MARISNNEIMKEIDNLYNMKEELLNENKKIKKFERKLEKNKLNAKFLLLSTAGFGMLTLASISSVLLVPCALLTTCFTLTTLEQIKMNRKDMDSYEGMLIKLENNKQMAELLLRNIDAYDSVYNHRKNHELSKENVQNVNYFLKYENDYKEDVVEINEKYNYNSDEEVSYQKKIGVR